MRNKGSVDFTRFAVPLLAAIAIPLAFVLGGPLGAAGLLIGATTGALSLWISSRVVRAWFTPTSERTPAVVRLYVAFAIKLPVFAVVIIFTTSLGVGAVYGFLLGIVLVYSALIVGAARLGRAPANSDEE